jgi:hypothetical protein
MIKRQFSIRHLKRAKDERIAAARRERWPHDVGYNIQNAKQYAFAIVVHGGRFTQIAQILAFCNIQTPSSWMFYRAQKDICNEILAFAKESCRVWREQMAPGTIIGTDGSWSQRRNAMHCLVDFIDVVQGKIVDFEILQRPSGFLYGDYFGPANGMEVEGVRRIITRWQQVYQRANEKVAFYVHDRDAKTRKLISELWNKPELLDPNHVLKGFDRKLGADPGLRGLKTKLRSWFVFLLKLEETEQEKRRLWLNSSNHFQGIHDGCLPHPHIPNPPLKILTNPSGRLASIETGAWAVDEILGFEARKAGRPPASKPSRCQKPDFSQVTGQSSETLTGQRSEKVTRQSAEKVTQIRAKIEHLEHFLRDTEDLFCRIRPGITTQLNESLHARKAKTASKDIAWQGSWPARVAAAILDINRPGWRLELYNQLGLPKLTPEAEQVIRDHDRGITERAASRQQPSEKRKRRLAREVRRNYSRTIEQQNPQYKGIAKTETKKHGDLLTHKILDEAVTRRFRPRGENGSDEDSDYHLPVNDEEEEEDEYEEDTGCVDQPSVGPESSDDEDDPSSCQLRNEISQLSTEAQEWASDDDEPFVVQPWHKFDEVDLMDS